MSNSPQEKTHRELSPKNPSGTVSVELDEAHSPLKVLAHPGLLKKIVSKEKVNPIHLRIGITNGCNIRCSFCNFHSPNESTFYDHFSYSDKLDTEKTVRFLEEFADLGGKAVTFCGAGESTTHPGYDAICTAAHKAGLKIGLITNGTMLHRKAISDCIINTHTWVRIGLNAGNAASYASITNQKDEVFTKILEPIRHIRENAIEQDFKIGFNFVITQDNYGEIVDAARISKDAHVHYVRYEPEFYTALGHDTIEKILPHIIASLSEAKDMNDEFFKVSIPKLDRGRMSKTDLVEGDFVSCHYSKFTTALGADGYMYPCPQVHLSGPYRMGKAIDAGYKAWDESEAKQQWFKENPDRRDLCKTCFYRSPNELIEWLMRGDMDLEHTLEEYDQDVSYTLHPDFI